MLERRQEFAFLTCGEVSVLRRISHRCARRVQEGTNRAWPGQKDSSGTCLSSSELGSWPGFLRHQIRYFYFGCIHLPLIKFR